MVEKEGHSSCLQLPSWSYGRESLPPLLPLPNVLSVKTRPFQHPNGPHKSCQSKPALQSWSSQGLKRRPPSPSPLRRQCINLSPPSPQAPTAHCEGRRCWLQHPKLPPPTAPPLRSPNLGQCGACGKRGWGGGVEGGNRQMVEGLGAEPFPNHCCLFLTFSGRCHGKTTTEKHSRASPDQWYHGLTHRRESWLTFTFSPHPTLLPGRLFQGVPRPPPRKGNISSSIRVRGKQTFCPKSFAASLSILGAFQGCHPGAL